MSVRITIQVFSNGKAVCEKVANVHGVETEDQAVDKFLHHARIDLRYRFLGNGGIVRGSDPALYLLFDNDKGLPEAAAA